MYAYIPHGYIIQVLELFSQLEQQHGVKLLLFNYFSGLFLGLIQISSALFSVQSWSRSTKIFDRTDLSFLAHLSTQNIYRNVGFQLAILAPKCLAVNARSIDEFDL